MSLYSKRKARLTGAHQVGVDSISTNTTRVQTLLLVGLSLVALLSRLPFRTQALYHWDSVNFALALDHFDLHLHQPHPPGYILYVLMGRWLNGLLNDPNASLVWISVVSGSLLIPALVVAGRALFNRRVGYWTGALALVSPLFWFHGEIALSYATEALLVTLLAVLFFRLMQGEGRALLPAALLLALAGGLRQNTVLFVTPLWLVALAAYVRQTGGWRQAGMALVVFAAVCLAWLMPMAAATGGLAEYLHVVRSESTGIAAESSLLDPGQLAVNGGRLVMFTVYALGPGLLAWPLGMYDLWDGRRTHVRDRRFWLFVLWIGPALLFYVLIHIRQPGHTFTFMPALALLTAAALDRLYRRWPTWAAVLLGVTLVSNLLFFLFAPPALFGSQRLLFSTPGRRSLSQQDAFITRRVEAIRDRFDPATTAILASDRYFRHPDFYLADYRRSGLSHQLETAPQAVGEPVTTLVLFNDEVVSWVAVPLEVQKLALPGAPALAYLELGPGEQLILTPDAIRPYQPASE